MDRLDWAVVAATAVLVVVAVAVGDFAGVFSVVAAGAALVAVNHTVPRRPRLVVEYRNREADGRPEVWSAGPATLYVHVRNEGRGPAEAVEVRFDGLGAAEVWNETGNPPDRRLDRTVSPLHYVAGDRVLNPGQEWCIAMLVWRADHPLAGGTAAWRASARGVPERTGSVRVRVLGGTP